ncbi:M3 family metallopeptidase [Nocardioides mesophilus]|uniref:M3 family metallopeptidase n=1 Tax=Nocardioides mesophilus TaxID=433659 RepID=A0A7G9RAD3_9ACTN|nr:M3 family metallopeptidase [Nocardioides mesophilus]QNN52558.1 M3 family metallopeptidase [Nocardioides mesophilus]
MALDHDNPFATPSTLPFALPPFDRIRAEHFRPAFDAGVAEQRAEIEAIVGQDEAATFANTVEPLERSGALLDRTMRVFHELANSMATPAMQELEAVLVPEWSAHRDALLLDQRLFARVDAVRAQADGLTEEQRRVVERHHTDFVRAGAALPAGQQERLRQLNDEISRATTTFGSTLLAATNASALHVTDRDELDGLSEGAVQSAALAAKERGLDGYVLTLSSPTIQPLISSLRDRDLRRRLHEASTTRGMRGGEHDTRALVARIAALRAERAGLLGYPDHAAYVVADQTAGSTDAVVSMLDAMAAPAMANLERERVAIEAALHADGVEGPVQPWDWAYYAAKVKAAEYDVDTDELRPYFSLDRVLRDGVFLAAQRLYGLTFAERDDLPGYAPDVRTYEVRDGEGPDVPVLGLFVCDWFARPTKRGGAWMDEFVTQSRLLAQHPVVVVCLNVPKPAPGQPALMTVDEVRTAFHEFGHALHGLFSDVTYPRLAGTGVPRDFVEFPSQVNEMWAWDPEVLAGYARHHATGEPLPQEVADRLIASGAAGMGFDTVSMLGAALLDHEWHRLAPGADPVPAEDVEAFERAALERHGVASDLVPPRYRTGYFAHAFTNGYDAGYYSYLWSEVLDADMVGWFEENGGLRRANGDRFRADLLSRGGSVDPIAAFASIRGRRPSTEPLLRRRGLLG